MIKHVVVWRLKDKTTAHQAKLAIEAMRGRIRGLLSVEVGVNICRDEAASDLVLYSEFEDRAALESYATDPLHVPIKRLLANLALERRTIDYEV